MNTAQAFDEAAAEFPVASADSGAAGERGGVAPLLTELSQFNGVDFVLALGADKNKAEEFWGLDNPKPLAKWVRETLAGFRELGEANRTADRIPAGETGKRVQSG